MKKQDNPVPMSAIVRTLHTDLIARHGLRAAVQITRELHRWVENTLREQIQRHPAEWPEYSAQAIPAAGDVEKKIPAIPTVTG